MNPDIEKEAAVAAGYDPMAVVAAAGVYPKVADDAQEMPPKEEMTMVVEGDGMAEEDPSGAIQEMPPKEEMTMVVEGDGTEDESPSWTAPAPQEEAQAPAQAAKPAPASASASGGATAPKRPAPQTTESQGNKVMRGKDLAQRTVERLLAYKDEFGGSPFRQGDEPGQLVMSQEDLEEARRSPNSPLAQFKLIDSDPASGEAIYRHPASGIEIAIPGDGDIGGEYRLSVRPAGQRAWGMDPVVAAQRLEKAIEKMPQLKGDAWLTKDNGVVIQDVQPDEAKRIYRALLAMGFRDKQNGVGWEAGVPKVGKPAEGVVRPPNWNFMWPATLEHEDGDLTAEWSAVDAGKPGARLTVRFGAGKPGKAALADEQPKKKPAPTKAAEEEALALLELEASKHMGPGNHPDGSPQSVHGGHGGGWSPTTEAKPYRRKAQNAFDAAMMEIEGDLEGAYAGTRDTFLVLEHSTRDKPKIAAILNRLGYRERGSGEPVPSDLGIDDEKGQPRDFQSWVNPADGSSVSAYRYHESTGNRRLRFSFSNSVDGSKHYGPGPHPVSKTPQDVHGNGNEGGNVSQVEPRQTPAPKRRSTRIDPRSVPELKEDIDSYYEQYEYWDGENDPEGEDWAEIEYRAQLSKEERAAYDKRLSDLLDSRYQRKEISAEELDKRLEELRSPWLPAFRRKREKEKAKERKEDEEWERRRNESAVPAIPERSKPIDPQALDAEYAKLGKYLSNLSPADRGPIMSLGSNGYTSWLERNGFRLVARKRRQDNFGKSAPGNGDAP